MAGLYANSPSDFNTPTFDARYSTLPSERDSMSNTLKTGAKPLADMASVATSSWKAFENYILGKGATALEKGIAELKEAGQLNPEMEAAFRAIDPNDREQLGKALSSMAQLRSNWTNDTRVRDFANTSGKAELEKSLNTIKNSFDARIQAAKTAGDEQTAITLGIDRDRAMQKAMKQSKEAVRTDAMYKLEQPAYDMFVKRFGESKESKEDTTATGKRTEWEIRKFILKTLSPKDASPVIATLEDVTPKIQQDLDPKLWGTLANQNTAFRKFGNFLQSAKQQMASAIDTMDRGVIQRMLARGAELFGIGEKDEKTLGITPEQRASLNRMNGKITMMMSDFIRSKSGLTVTDTERDILLSALNLQNYSSVADFTSSYNSVVNQLREYFLNEEDIAKSADEDMYDEIKTKLTKGVPSDRLNKLFLTAPKEEPTVKGKPPEAETTLDEATVMAGLTKGNDGYYRDTRGNKFRFHKTKGKVPVSNTVETGEPKADKQENTSRTGKVEM